LLDRQAQTWLLNLIVLTTLGAHSTPAAADSMAVIKASYPKPLHSLFVVVANSTMLRLQPHNFSTAQCHANAMPCCMALAHLFHQTPSNQ
jgi:hypothetical protein